MADSGQASKATSPTMPVRPVLRNMSHQEKTLPVELAAFFVHTDKTRATR